MPESQQSIKGTNMIVSRILADRNNIVLDFGCGEGKWGRLLKGKVKVIDGIEVWEPYIKKYNLNRFYDTLYNVDLREFAYEKDYTVAILGDVFEHLPQEEALSFLDKLKTKVPRIFLTLPITYCRQGAAQGNPFEAHHYHWSDKEIRHLGFKLLNVSVNDNGLVAVGCYEWGR